MCTLKGCVVKVVAPCGIHYCVVSAFSGKDGCLTSLLKVTVDLEAVIPRVRHRHVAVRGEGQALGTIKGVC